MHTLDIAPLCSESLPQKRSDMARVLIKGFHSFTCTPTCSSAIGMSHTPPPLEVDNIFAFIRQVAPVPACWLFKTSATS